MTFLILHFSLRDNTSIRALAMLNAIVQCYMFRWCRLPHSLMHTSEHFLEPLCTKQRWQSYLLKEINVMAVTPSPPKICSHFITTRLCCSTETFLPNSCTLFCSTVIWYWTFSYFHTYENWNCNWRWSRQMSMASHIQGHITL